MEQSRVAVLLNPREWLYLLSRSYTARYIAARSFGNGGGCGGGKVMFLDGNVSSDGTDTDVVVVGCNRRGKGACSCRSDGSEIPAVLEDAAGLDGTVSGFVA